MKKETRLVKVLNDNKEVVLTYKVNVDTELADRLIKLSQHCMYQHTAMIVNGDFSREHEVSYLMKNHVDCRISVALVGGAVTDMLLGLKEKDFDILYTYTEDPGYQNMRFISEEKGLDPDLYEHCEYVDYEGITYPLSSCVGSLSKPYCYMAGPIPNQNVQCYKTKNKRVDFLFTKFIGSSVETAPYEFVVNTFDQDIKLGIYNGEEFIIHEDMYNALQTRTVSYNKRLGEPSTKESKRLALAQIKYGIEEEEILYAVEA